MASGWLDIRGQHALYCNIAIYDCHEAQRLMHIHHRARRTSTTAQGYHGCNAALLAIICPMGALQIALLAPAAVCQRACSRPRVPCAAPSSSVAWTPPPRCSRTTSPTANASPPVVTPLRTPATEQSSNASHQARSTTQVQCLADASALCRAWEPWTDTSSIVTVIKL